MADTLLQVDRINVGMDRQQIASNTVGARGMAGVAEAPEITRHRGLSRESPLLAFGSRSAIIGRSKVLNRRLVCRRTSR